MTTFFVAKLQNGTLRTELTADEAAAIINIDTVDLLHDIEEEGCCDGLDAGGREVRIVANGDEFRLA